jgi:ABC-type transporter Mla maintaining outer membrane lipid asymmetry ATPase subunit MlaF
MTAGIYFALSYPASFSPTGWKGNCVMIVVENLVKSYNATRVLHGVDHAQKRGEAVVLIGPSGCGKSTFLRCLNQLEIADSGRITIGGVTIEADTRRAAARNGSGSGGCACRRGWSSSPSTCSRT